MTQEAKDQIARRKIAYVYLMHRLFEGNPTKMIRTMGFSGIAVGDVQEWDSEYKEAVYKTIQEEDSRGVKLRDMEDVPSIKSIKEKVLRRVDQIIAETTDPSRLAMTYKVLSEYEVADDRKEKSVLDAINESLKPLYPRKGKKEGSVTMLEKMKKQGGFVARKEDDEEGEETDNEEQSE